MMSKTAQTTAPRVEALLYAAHRDYGVLRERRDALVRCGIASDHLPDEVALMAFALLGDHDRTSLAAGLDANWQALQSKGLARGAIADASTPELRLLAHALAFTDAIEDVWQRLERVTQAAQAPHGTVRCATRVQGLWGQLARLHFSAEGTAYVLIAPDPVFGLQTALLAAEPSGRCAGSFTFPIDNGAITLTLLQRSGEVFRHVVRSVVDGIEGCC